MLEAISAALSAMLKDESTFARAEALYAESFRCGATFTVASDAYPRDELVRYLMEPIYKPVAATGNAAAYFGDNDEEDFYPEPEILKAGLSLEEADALVDSLEFAELCNYKGEGEGYELACRVTHLRVFAGKYDYRAA
ncbi:hypothetical protein [Pseudomonas sp. UMAB-40]|uniref:hypothetical protein n=1 Tax=Pseudomonas sp. UMAB-40 TaxID=1365407 RepID=UPI001C56682C|nr:hypothetical protein [Pseudomonas sp. UMAB-40]